MLPFEEPVCKKKNTIMNFGRDGFNKTNNDIDDSKLNVFGINWVVLC